MPKVAVPVDTLIQQLHSRDWMTRCEAARLLGQSRDPRAVVALLPDLNDSDWRVRRNAAQALGALGDQRATEPLLQALQDRTLTVRQRAIVALGRIKDPQSLPVLLKILQEDERLSYEASRAIRKFGKKALPEIAKVFEQSNHQQLMLLLVEMKYEGALDLMLKSLECPDIPTRLTVIRELGKFGNKKAISGLIDQLQHSDPMIQSEAVRALGKLEARETIPALLNLLVDDELYGPHSHLYHAVTEAFHSFGSIAEEIKNAFPGSYPAMFNVGGAPLSLPEAMGLLGNDQSQILNDAFTRFQSGNIPIDVPGLPQDTIQQAFEDMAWRFGVMFADASDAKQERVKRLTELLKSESNLRRAAAALTLPWYTDERAVEPLEQARQDPDEIVRTTATWAFQALQKTLLYRKQRGS
jgi:HEAT repeat protein